MKIRSITLSDIRQFTRPVTVGGFAAGLNVLAAPNEAGKSTLFDAIHALFFIPHRSSRIGHLRPEAGALFAAPRGTQTQPAAVEYPKEKAV